MWKASVAEHLVALATSVFLFTALTYWYELTRCSLRKPIKRTWGLWFPDQSALDRTLAPREAGPAIEIAIHGASNARRMQSRI
jgi:hypothetical protein